MMAYKLLSVVTWSILNLDNQTGLMTHFMFKATNAEILNIINVKPTAITHAKNVFFKTVNFVCSFYQDYYYFISQGPKNVIV